MNYYMLEASKNVEDYVSVTEGIREFAKACQLSEFQFLDTTPVKIEVDKSSGRLFQDFLYDEGVPLISDRMKECFDALEIDYLFYKKILLTKRELGIEEIYWLALPERINCLNREESEIDEILNIVDEIVINENKVGRYEVFKLAGVGNLDIIISENVKEVLQEENLLGLHINKID